MQMKFLFRQVHSQTALVRKLSQRGVESAAILERLSCHLSTKLVYPYRPFILSLVRQDSASKSIVLREQGWCSGDSARLTPTWPGFNSRTRRPVSPSPSHPQSPAPSSRSALFRPPLRSLDCGVVLTSQ